MFSCFEKHFMRLHFKTFRGFSKEESILFFSSHETFTSLWSPSLVRRMLTFLSAPWGTSKFRCATPAAGREPREQLPASCRGLRVLKEGSKARRAVREGKKVHSDLGGHMQGSMESLPAEVIEALSPWEEVCGSARGNKTQWVCFFF